VLIVVAALFVALSVAAVAVTLWPAKKHDAVVSAPEPPADSPTVPIAASPPRPRPTRRAVGLEVGNRAMEISGEDIDGRRFKLSDYRGKVVVLDFWGNW
jgi:hypothetical protein